MIGAIVAIIAVAAIGLVLMVVWPACVVSGRISETERRTEQSQPNDNNDLSFGNGNEADNAL